MTHKNASENYDSSDTIDLWRYLQVLVSHRWMIIRNCALIIFLAVIISLILPKKYTAVATLLPPDQSRQSDALAAFAPTALSNLNLLNVNTTADLFVQILMSRTVQERVLLRTYSVGDQQMDLLAYFDVESVEPGLKKLHDATTVEALKEGIITLAVEVGDRVLAADVANAFIAELDSVNQSKNTSQAKSSRIYIENQLQLTKTRLDRADEALAEFQQSHKAISLEDQTRTAIEEAGKVKGLILAKEVELAMKLYVLKPNHPEVITIRNELTELRKQYQNLQYGDSAPVAPEEKEFYIPMADVPDVALRLAELMREVKVQETIWGLLNQQYYQAKIQEAKDTPTVQVLDKAVPPELRSKPKRGFIVILAFGVTLFLSIFWAFFLEYVSKLSHHKESSEKIQSLKEVVQQDKIKIIAVLQKATRFKTSPSKKEE